MTDNQLLRSTFNGASRDYNAVRPGYPEALFEDVVSISGIPSGGRALEIGCGTGQATIPLARRGYSIVCLDIGENMLAMARENLREYPKVNFEHLSFEEWPGQANTFDLVYAATSFHWIPREIGYPKSAQVLKPGGALAIFSNQHPRPFSGFFVEVQPIYDRYMPDQRKPLQQLSTAEDIEVQVQYMQSTGLFSSIEVRTYPWIHTYTTADYIRLLNTYSDHLALEEERRKTLHHAIAELIDRRYDGKVVRPYLTVLYCGLVSKEGASGSCSA